MMLMKVLVVLILELLVASVNAGKTLTLKVPITTAADDIHKYFFIFFRENKT